MVEKTHSINPRIETADKNPIQEAIDYGIDVSQLRDNLALSIIQRLQRHQIALNTVEMLRKAKRR